ncbi:DUF4880 domain-containing protein [Variovorax paradoxus]|uniref:DUF4880 domain-containing protein n=1 Tax=Variovorax paradoxus TaxID=34073 RepID=UPI0029C831C0|nr:DUF4880 domain-containing protein [Variovorax paradoxus]
MTASASRDRALDAAVDWRVCQESNRFGERERQAFEHWLSSDPDNQAAWARVSGGVLEAPLETVRAFRERGAMPHAQAAVLALHKVRRRRVFRGALAVAGTAATAGLLADRLTPIGELTADLHTGTAQRKNFALADGTDVLLDARSAVDVLHRSGATQLRLRSGALIATPAASMSASVLTIDTPYCRVLGEGARVHCRAHASATEVVAMDGALQVQLADGRSIRLRAGEGASASNEALQPLAGRAADRAAWRDGMLAVRDWTLGETVDALRAYHAGFIRVSRPAAALRVFGIFRLDVDDALAALAYTLPLQVQRLGPWLVSIDVEKR